MIRVLPGIAIEENELEFTFVASPGPGGQNVNKVATAAQLRFDVARSPSLSDPVKRRLLKLAGSKATREGEVVITASRQRTQGRNREDATQRLVELIRRAAHRPRPRKRTKPTAASKRRRLRNKRHQGEIKRLRRPPKRDD